MSDDEQTITVHGVAYRAVIAAAGCNGGYHWHEEPHPDGSVGAVSHHHHGPACGRRTAVLVPVNPPWPEMLAEPAAYRAYVDGEAIPLTAEQAAARAAAANRLRSGQ